MDGTQKQVKWAKDIKRGFLAEVEKLRDRHLEQARKAGQEVEFNRTLDLMIATVTANTDAKWWIDNRDIDSVVSNEFKSAYQTAAQQVKETKA